MIDSDEVWNGHLNAYDRTYIDELRAANLGSDLLHPHPLTAFSCFPLSPYIPHFSSIFDSTDD